MKPPCILIPLDSRINRADCCIVGCLRARSVGEGTAARVRSPRPQAGTREPLTTLPRSARSRVSWSLAETRYAAPPLTALTHGYKNSQTARHSPSRAYDAARTSRANYIRAVRDSVGGERRGVLAGGVSRSKRPAGCPHRAQARCGLTAGARVRASAQRVSD